jgi:hypothetical protein
VGTRQVQVQIQGHDARPFQYDQVLEEAATQVDVFAGGRRPAWWGGGGGASAAGPPGYLLRCCPPAPWGRPGGEQAAAQRRCSSPQGAAAPPPLGRALTDLGRLAPAAAAAGMPVVDNCLAGYNSSIFAYGQTGSGKTHTVLGQLGSAELVRLGTGPHPAVHV